MQEVGKNIKERRQRMETNQETFAENAGISIRKLSDIECGKGNPTFRTLDRIAAAFGVQIEELLQPEMVVDLLPPNDLSRFQPMLDQLSAQGRAMVIAGLEGAIVRGLEYERRAAAPVETEIQ